MKNKSCRIITVSSNIFTKKELSKYEEIILDNRNITERQVSKFFTKFPKFLTIGGYKEIIKEVTIYKPNNKTFCRVDFLRKKYGDDFWDFVELKSPNSHFIVKKGKHLKLSSIIEAGIHQSLNYRDLLDDENVRINLEKQSGIKSFRPNILLVGGRNPEGFDPIELKRLKSRYSNLEIKSYDELYLFAMDNYKSNLFVIPINQPTVSINYPDRSNFDEDNISQNIEDMIIRKQIHEYEMHIYNFNKEYLTLVLNESLKDKGKRLTYKIKIKDYIKIKGLVDSYREHKETLDEFVHYLQFMPASAPISFVFNKEQFNRIVNELGGEEKAANVVIETDSPFNYL